jgi:hypothetical protein
MQFLKVCFILSLTMSNEQASKRNKTVKDNKRTGAQTAGQRAPPALIFRSIIHPLATNHLSAVDDYTYCTII